MQGVGRREATKGVQWAFHVWGTSKQGENLGVGFLLAQGRGSHPLYSQSLKGLYSWGTLIPTKDC